MANQGYAVFLEEWLIRNSGVDDNISSRHSSSSSARTIIQAWTDLRDSLNIQLFDSHCLQSLKILCDCQSVLHVADPHAKLLVAILSLPNVSLPQEAYPLFLRLLYIWVRKSSKQSSLVIDSTVEVLFHIFSVKFNVQKSSILYSEGVLLLGAVSLVPSISVKSKKACLELLCKLLEEEYQLIYLSRESIPKVLAGIGYSLYSSGKIYFVRVIDSLFEMWEKRDGPCGSVPHGLMVLHLIEWVLSNCMNSHAVDKVNLFRSEMLGNRKPSYSIFALVMAAGGVLRFLNRSGSNGLQDLRNSAEKLIERVASQLLSRAGSVRCPRNSLLLQCISLATAQSGSISFSAPLVSCLALGLLDEVFPLRRIYAKILELPSPESQGSLLYEVKEHLSSNTFKEGGAITGVFCNQYIAADKESKNILQNLIWEFCQDIYLQHQKVALVLRPIKTELLGNVEKIAESAFLMVVLFALAVTKYNLNSNLNQNTNLTLSVRILVSFSCMEYFRRMRLPEYLDTIRAVVVSVQENESACISFVESMPSYRDLTSFPKVHELEYIWSTDDVQTARILFYMRVIPTCIEHIPTSLFRKVVAPTMFLYMGHPNTKVARASHSIFVAFISSGKDVNQDERTSLKEQLVFYYMQRSLEGYPGITPFEGLASGVAALVRHLPAGSPSIFYCIHSVLEKANSLCSGVNVDEADSLESREGSWEACKKLLDLLLRLLSMVDIQVLSSLMKGLAQLVVQLPKDRQNVILNQLSQHVAESDDVTRKPTLVSWLQSLSYLCSKDSTNQRATDGMRIQACASPMNVGSLSPNVISSRL